MSEVDYYSLSLKEQKIYLGPFAARFIIDELKPILTKNKKELSSFSIDLATYLLYTFYVDKWIDRRHAKEIIQRVIDGEDVLLVISDEKYEQEDISSFDSIILEEWNINKQKIIDKPVMLNWLVGQIMKKTQGKANPSEVRTKLEELLKAEING